MNKLILISAVIIILSGATLVIASYSFGTITGYAVVEQAIKLDIMGSSNDASYNLSSVSQGETHYSPKIKIINNGNATIPVDILLNSSSDIAMVIVDENQTQELANPVQVPASDLYVYVKHVFPASIAPGNYSFSISIISAE